MTIAKPTSCFHSRAPAIKPDYSSPWSVVSASYAGRGLVQTFDSGCHRSPIAYRSQIWSCPVASEASFASASCPFLTSPAQARTDFAQVGHHFWMIRGSGFRCCGAIIVLHCLTTGVMLVGCACRNRLQLHMRWCSLHQGY